MTHGIDINHLIAADHMSAAGHSDRPPDIAQLSDRCRRFLDHMKVTSLLVTNIRANTTSDMTVFFTYISSSVLTHMEHKNGKYRLYDCQLNENRLEFNRKRASIIHFQQLSDRLLRVGKLSSSASIYFGTLPTINTAHPQSSSIIDILVHVFRQPFLTKSTIVSITNNERTSITTQMITLAKQCRPTRSDAFATDGVVVDSQSTVDDLCAIFKKIKANHNQVLITNKGISKSHTMLTLDINGDNVTYTASSSLSKMIVHFDIKSHRMSINNRNPSQHDLEWIVEKIRHMGSALASGACRMVFR